MNFDEMRWMFVLLAGLVAGQVFGAASLDTGFEDPAMEYGPRTWWHWINERVTKDGITKDLEAMKMLIFY